MLRLLEQHMFEPALVDRKQLRERERRSRRQRLRQRFRQWFWWRQGLERLRSEHRRSVRPKLGLLQRQLQHEQQYVLRPRRRDALLGPLVQ
jgi:hypothetical protein